MHGDTGVCHRICDVVTSLGVFPRYSKEYHELEDEEQLKMIDEMVSGNPLETGEHFGCVHFEAKPNK